MMAYAFHSLHEKEYSKVVNEEFENASDLLGAILAIGINNQIKRGLSRSYVEHTDEISSPKGKIEISQSLDCISSGRQKLVCSFEAFSEDNDLNRVLKCTAMLLIKSSEIKNSTRSTLRKAMFSFSEVTLISEKDIKWECINFNRNNATYYWLINVCRMLISELLPNSNGNEKTVPFYLDDQKMHRLFEKFVLEYYKKHHPNFKPKASNIEWVTDNGYVDLLPAMKSDILLSNQDKTMIIDTKYYSHMLQSNELYGSKSQHSHNLYQIFTYVKNHDTGNVGKVIGILLYARTEEGILPDRSYALSGNSIVVRSIDLFKDFSEIRNQLDTLVTIM